MSDHHDHDHHHDNRYSDMQARVKALEIRWPSGVRQRLEDVAADQVLKVRESSN